MADSIEAIEAKEAENASWARTAKDLFSGAAGGVAQVLLGEFMLDDAMREKSERAVTLKATYNVDVLPRGSMVLLTLWVVVSKPKSRSKADFSFDQVNHLVSKRHNAL